MHEVMFRLKRAHLRAVEFAKPLAALFGLTPARFDVLYVLKHSSAYVLSQRQIGDELGLAPATISKILERMEACGLVRRDWFSEDRRAKAVTMTSRGFDAIGAAVHAFLRLDKMRAAYRAIHGTDPQKSQAFLAMVRRSLRKIAGHFGDRSTLAYPTRAMAPRDGEDALRHDIRRWRIFVDLDAQWASATAGCRGRGGGRAGRSREPADVVDDAAAFLRELVSLAPQLRHLYE